MRVNRPLSTHITTAASSIMHVALCPVPPCLVMLSLVSRCDSRRSRAAPPRFAWRASRRAAASRQQGLTTLGELSLHNPEPCGLPGSYHARMARRAQHLRCSHSERADNKLDKPGSSWLYLYYALSPLGARKAKRRERRAEPSNLWLALRAPWRGDSQGARSEPQGYIYYMF